MIKFEGQTIVARSPEHAFALAGDWTQDPKWVEARLRVTPVSSGDVGVGSTFDLEVRTPVGKVVRLRGEIIDHQPPLRTSLRATGGPVTLVETRTFRPVGGGTEVQIEVSLDLPPGLGYVMGPIARRRGRGETDAALARLRRLLEVP